MRYHVVVYKLPGLGEPIDFHAPVATFEQGFDFHESSHKVADVMGIAVGQLVAEGGQPDTAPVPGEVEPRIHLAWLMYCYQQGYTAPVDRAGLTNWLGDHPSTLHPDDVERQRDLLRMADEILALIGHGDG